MNSLQRLTRVLIWIVVAVGLLIGSLWIFQRRLIYLPDGGVPPLGDVLTGWQDARLQTADGLELEGWFRRPDSGSPVVIVFNGNAGNRSGRAQLGSRLASDGLGVLLFDYRGYGDNAGDPTEQGLALDARAALAFVEAKAPGHAVVYFGESLGAAVAIELAIGHPPAALALRSPFTSLADVASDHYPLLPVRMLLWDEYPSLDRVGRVDSPVLVIAGSHDTIVATEQSIEIFEAAPDPKELLIIEGADHNDAALLIGDELLDALLRFAHDAANPLER